ncbi:hypothetical protein LJC08_01440 [Methanimicrococcus sp. OttesenSCG-928-J09]|nr:hypothetical protein [Methanimicrococcus sp. OttesenSCG-928-J09]
MEIYGFVPIIIKNRINLIAASFYYCLLLSTAACFYLLLSAICFCFHTHLLILRVFRSLTRTCHIYLTDSVLLLLPTVLVCYCYLTISVCHVYLTDSVTAANRLRARAASVFHNRQKGTAIFQISKNGKRFKRK